MEENLTTYHHLDLVRIILFAPPYYFFIIDTTSAVLTNITSMISNCTNISVFWDSSVLNYQYNLEIYDGTTNQLLKSVLVYDTSYHFEDTELFYHHYNIMYVITAVNELGEGLSNSATFSYQRGIICNIIFAFL